MGRPRILGLEVAVKGVDEEHDVTVGDARSTEIVGSPARQRTAREAQWALEQRGGEIREWRHARRERRVARQEPDRPIASTMATARVVMGEKLDLHARHVHTGRAFALAALARDAEIERRLDRLVALGAELARQREAQRVGAAAREVDLLARRAIRRAHRPGVELAA